MSEGERQPDEPLPPPLGERSSLGNQEFRWQAFFQRSQEPLFLLNRHRRILFVNHAWETLTGISADEARQLTCARRATPDSGKAETVAQLLCPPAEVHSGKSGRTRRLVTRPDLGSLSWEVDFFPLRSEQGLLGVLGRITVLTSLAHPESPSLPQALVALHQRVVRDEEGEERKVKSWQPEQLIALRHRMVERHRLDQLPSTLPVMQQIADQVRLVSQNPVPVTILGESGVGKQWLARVIHHHGSTTELPFRVVDCAHLPPKALASVLFGDGAARLSHLGTLYLKDPASLPRDLQARLWDQLASADASKPTPRLIAGACLDLAEESRQGRLMQELACALSTVVLRLPPLRERLVDLPWLVEQMLERIGMDLERPISGLSPEAWEMLKAYPWPGNLRELYNALHRACRVATTDRIDTPQLPPYLRRIVKLQSVANAEADRPLPLDELLIEAEKRLILLALKRAQGKKWKAADLLQIERPRLFRRLKALGLVPAKEAEPEAEVHLDESEE